MRSILKDTWVSKSLSHDRHVNAHLREVPKDISRLQDMENEGGREQSSWLLLRTTHGGAQAPVKRATRNLDTLSPKRVF